MSNFLERKEFCNGFPSYKSNEVKSFVSVTFEGVSDFMASVSSYRQLF